MAADSDPYFAFPSLYGAPAYGRPPRPALDTRRPFDPDDLPIVAEQTADEREIAAALLRSGHFPGDTGHASAGAAGLVRTLVASHAGGGGPTHAGEDVRRSEQGGHRLGLRGLTGRIGSRGR